MSWRVRLGDLVLDPEPGFPAAHLSIWANTPSMMSQAREYATRSAAKAARTRASKVSPRWKNAKLIEVNDG